MADNPNNKKRISASSFLGNDRYESYIDELTAQSTIAGKDLTPSERKEAFKKRNNKVAFKTFVEKVLQRKAVATAKVKPIGIRALPSAGGALAKIAPQPEAQRSSFSIVKVLDSILATLNNQLKFDKKTDADEKKEEENEKRKKRENALETVKKIGGKIIDKVIAPFKSIMDRIWNFIFYTLLGRAFTKLMDWLGDPKNAQKVAVLGRFLKDWWPALLGLYFMPFKGFMLKTLGRIAWFAGKFAFKKLPRFLVSNPLVSAGLTTGLAASIGTAKERERIEKIAKEQGTEAPKFGGGSIWETIGQSFNLIGAGLQGTANGGYIDSNTGIKITGAGPDTQLTALQPGEIVMNRAAVRAIGAEKLLKLNAIHGGANANKPRFANNIQFASNGGMISSNVNPNISFSPNITQYTQKSQSGVSQNYTKFKSQLPRFSGGGFLGTGTQTPKSTSSSYFIPMPFSSGGSNNFIPVPVSSNIQQKSPKISISSQQQKSPKMSMNFFGGGLVKHTTGITMLGGTADRQIVALQPGEYVLPTDTVSNLGVSLIDKLVAMTDSNSNPTKLGKRSKRYVPGPLSRSGRGGMISLPPITQSAGAVPAVASGTQVPSFSAVSPSGGSDRAMNASIYGIV